MAFNDFDVDQISSHLGGVQSPTSPVSPQDPGQYARSIANFEIHSSSRRIRNRYKSAFREVGLDEVADTTKCKMRDVITARPGSRVRWRSDIDIQEAEQPEERGIQPETTRAIPTTTYHQSGSSAILSRLSFVAVVIAIMIPVIHMSPSLHAGPAIIGAEAGPIALKSARHHELEATKLLPRQSNPADTCLRWSQQSAVVNGTLYMYGGRAKTDSNQDSNTWSKLG